MAANDIVNDNRNMATTYSTLADSASYEAKVHADRVIADLQAIFADPFEFTPGDLPDLDAVVAPDDFTDNYIPPTLSATEPTFLAPIAPDLADEAPGSAPTLDLSGLFALTPPTWNVPDISAPLPTLAPITIPPSPTLSLPSEPESAGNRLSAPQITTPAFDATFDAVAPETSDLRAVFAGEYANRYPAMVAAVDDWIDASIAKFNPRYVEAMASLEAKLAQGMEGQAFDDGFEERLYERERTRVIAEREAIERASTDAFAKRGFVIPPGMMTGALAQAQEAASRNLALAASNTHIERARLELSHVQFVMQVSSSIRSGVMNAALNYVGQMTAINAQCIDIAYRVAAFVADTFNQSLQLYQAAMQIYTSEAEVYKTRIEAAFAQLRVFQAEIDAERLIVDLDQANTALYRAKIDGQKALIDIYLGELQGVDAQVRQQTLLLQVFEAQVRSYVAQIQGKESEYGAYKAAIEGDSAKVSAQAEAIRAFGVEVDAYRARIDAGRLQLESTDTYNKVLADTYRSQLNTYEVETRAEAQRFGASVESYQARLRGYISELDAYSTKSRVAIEQDRLTLTASLGEFDGNLKARIADANLDLDALKIRSSVAIDGAGMLRDISTAALQANSALIADITEA